MKNQYITLEQAQERVSRFGDLKFLNKYKPQIRRWKIPIAVIATIGLILTPGTNWLLFPLGLWLLK